MGAKIEETRCKPKTKRKRKPMKKATQRDKPKRKNRCTQEQNGMRCDLWAGHKAPHAWRDPTKEKHPKECDYPRFSGKIDQESTIFQTFNRTAKLLGEVEAGVDAFFRLAQHHGLMAAPADGEASICTQHAAQITDDVARLQALLSTEAKLVMPVLFMLIGDQTAARAMGVELDESEAAGETIH